MAVETPAIQIDPYTSTVPLVQVPQQDLATPPPAKRLDSKGGGIAEVGDSIFKGLIKGLQMKEEKKYNTAQASITALDKSTSDAYANYQQSLATGKKEESDAAYGVYLKSFNDGKQAKAQFAIPENKPKEKGKKGDKKDDQGGVATGGFGAGLKQFFERNPHIIPELSLLAMQPKPPGPSVDTVKQKNALAAEQRGAQQDEQVLAEGKRKAQAEAVYDELGQKPESELKSEEAQRLDWAKSVLYPDKFTGRYFVYTDGKGNRQAFHPGTEPPGWTVDKTSSASGEPKPGTVGDFLTTVAKDNQTSQEKFNAGQKGYLEQLWHFYQQNPTASANTSWYLDDKGNWETRSAPGYHGPVPPKPQAGLFPRGFNLPGSKPQSASPQAGAGTTRGGMSAPPSAPTRTATSSQRGGISAPPGQRPMRSWQAAQNTEKVETEKKDRYAAAQKKHDAAIALARTKAKTPEALEQFKKQANDALEADKTEIGKWYAQQVHAVGGTVAGETPDIRYYNGYAYEKNLQSGQWNLKAGQ